MSTQTPSHDTRPSTPNTYAIREGMWENYFSAFTGIAFLALFSLVLLIWSLGQSQPTIVVGAAVGLLGLFVSVTTAVIVTRMAMRGPLFTICVDGEGIWHKHIGRKDGLVRWKSLRGVRRRRGQRLELIDDRSEVVVRLHPQIQALGELTEKVVERAPQVRLVDRSGHLDDGDCPLRPPSVYHCRPIRYYGFVGLLSLLLAAFLRTSDVMSAGSTGLLAILFWRGRFVRRLEMSPEYLDLILLTRQRRLAPDEVVRIEVADVSITGSFAGFFHWLDFTGLDSEGVVIVTREPETHYALYDMGVHPEDLARRLNAWRDATVDEHNEPD